jgi:hypothetical protein
MLLFPILAGLVVLIFLVVNTAQGSWQSALVLTALVGTSAVLIARRRARKQ